MNIEKITLSRVYRNDKDREGNQLLDYRTKKPITGIGIQTVNMGDRWLNGEIKYAKDPRMTWEAGMTVEVVVEQRGERLCFRLPNRLDILVDDMAKVKKHLGMDQEEVKVYEEEESGIPF